MPSKLGLVLPLELAKKDQKTFCSFSFDLFIFDCHRIIIQSNRSNFAPTHLVNGFEEELLPMHPKGAIKRKYSADNACLISEADNVTSLTIEERFLIPS
ncbi:unnamed protein product [Prunus armeniaca]|uniref:Uncharacterized protein n=1 Tax=Prunus armeniaca TaxID=36596 RepID=A0A6J5UI47_PRUAR|nr:unnamed protein product [Prunus armeniaca]